MHIFKFNRSICVFAKCNFREFIMCVFGGGRTCVCVCLCVYMKCHYVVVFKKNLDKFDNGL